MFASSVPWWNAPTQTPDLASYDRIIVASSGGQGSIRGILTLA